MRVDRGVRRWAVVLAALLAASTPAAAAIAAQAPTTNRSLPREEPTQPEPVSEAARAAALAEPAIVQIEVHWEGSVRTRGTGEVLDPDPVSASTRCTGAGVAQGGYLLTTRSCLDLSAVAAEAFRQLVDRQVADGRIPAEAADGLLSDLLLSATIGVDLPGEEPAARTITVRRAVTDDDEPMRASVVAVADPADGDAALLKIGRSNQPVLPLASDGDLSIGTELVTVRCPPPAGDKVGTTASAPADAGDDHLRPAFSSGTVAKNDPHVLVEPAEPAEPGAEVTGSGGVVLTHDAAIAGLVDTSLTTGDLLVDLPTIRALLTEADVETGLGQVDQDYRAGLDAFYQGRYADAIARFDAVLAIIPSHIQAHQYRDAAQSLRDDGAEPPPTDEVVDQVESWLDRLESWLGGRSWSLVGVLVLVAVVVFFLHHRRPPTDPETPSDDGAGGDAPASKPRVSPTRAAKTSAAEAPAADPR